MVVSSEDFKTVLRTVGSRPKWMFSLSSYNVISSQRSACQGEEVHTSACKRREKLYFVKVPKYCHLSSDAHEQTTEIPIPIKYLARPQPRERAWDRERGRLC